MSIKAGGKVSGVYGIKVLRNAGTDKEFIEDFGESPNMLLNGFFDRFASGNLKHNDWAMFVGSGTTPVEANQTQLVNQIGNIEYMFSNMAVNDNVKEGSDYISSTTGVAKWGVGGIVGNISEVGVRLGSQIGSTVDSRALIVDAQGNPTAITLTSNDKLEISYTLKYIIPIQQHVSVVDFLGVSTTCTLEPLGVLDKNKNNLSSAFVYGLSNAIYWSDNRPIYDNPEASIGSLSVASIGRTYSNPSTGVRRYSIFCDLDDMNTAGEIEYICISSADAYASFLGLHFSPKIPKDNTKTLTLNFDFTLTRA